MTLHPHWGHAELLSTLARARIQGSLPSTLLIHGPKGVGKQHLGLWLGRLLLCTNPGPEGPCEACVSCRLAGKLEHPDLHWYFPLPRPPSASTPERLERALEEARGEVLEEVRRQPLRPAVIGESRSIYLATARSLRKKAQRRPSLGDRQVFLIADAEALAPQESSSEAANALLKLLEEPPRGTTLILTSSEAGRLLPTIRSRTSQLHLPPLSPSEVTRFLKEIARVDPDEAEKAGVLSQGSIGRALGFLEDGGEPGALQQLRLQAFEIVTAALTETPATAFQLAGGFPSVRARALMDLLSFVEEVLRELAVEVSGGTRGGDPGTPKRFREALRRHTLHPTAAALAIRHVNNARTMASGNVNPQLVIFGLAYDLGKELRASHPASLVGIRHE